uniref:Reverse transcriptase domain-containing protein n=1 Tax=Fagus sylvatica TaxID=28930 RepID=A0A2N9ETM1_FAGSY
MWLKVKGFKVKVKLWWDLYQFSGTPSYILDNKLKARKLDLKKWNESKFRNISTDKKKLVNDMLELDLVVDRRPLVAKEKVKKEQIQADLEKDSVLIANECLDSRLKINAPGVLCKLNLETAFDHVNWDFLIYLLCRCGFSSKWRQWILFCLSTARFSIIVNGSPCDFFESTRGLHQGDSLSPMPFVIVMEALSRMMNKAIEGDNTLIFCDANPSQLLHLKFVLNLIEATSGLQINLGKSELAPIVFGGGWTTRVVNGPHGVGLWKNIRSGWEKFERLIAFKVGSGAQAKFWLDTWCGDAPLKVNFPKLYGIACDKKAYVADHMQPHHDLSNWQVNFVRAHDWELDSFLAFFDVLYSTKVVGHGEDKICWNPDNQKEFEEEHMGGEGSSSDCFLYLDCLSGKNSYGGQFKKSEHHLGELLLNCVQWKNCALWRRPSLSHVVLMEGKETLGILRAKKGTFWT